MACSGAGEGALVISSKKRATRGQFEFPINIVVCATESLVAPINIHLSLSSNGMTAALALSCSRPSDADRPSVRAPRYNMTTLSGNSYSRRPIQVGLQLRGLQ